MHRLDAESRRWTLWLSAEADGLNLGHSLGLPRAVETPLSGRLVVLGSIRFPDSASMTLKTRSIPRAVEIARLLRPVVGVKAKLTRVRVINRWFEAREAAADLERLDRCLDRDVTVIRWEETADELDALLEKGATPEAKRALHDEWHAARRHLGVPPVEDFPLRCADGLGPGERGEARAALQGGQALAQRRRRREGVSRVAHR